MNRPRTAVLLVLASLLAGAARAEAPAMPWREAGWTAEEAAAHLLSRFAYGARPGEVEAVAADPEGWFEAQLAAAAPEPVLTARLSRFRTLDLPTAEYPRRYPSIGALVQEAQAAGIAVPRPFAGAIDEEDLQTLRGQVVELARGGGIRSLYELLGELTAQKVLRAVYAENQLVEVMTDLWFNHFNVSLDDGLARPYVLAYERDALRPHALGRFRDLLGATARHPAMLFYLDNAQSTAAAGETTTLEARLPGRPTSRADGGLNENYARELLELHTLGDGGAYTQQDVVAVARAFTGWSAVPPSAGSEGMSALSSTGWAHRAGFVFDGAFVFRAGAHDAGPKAVLGRRLPPGRGIEDGEEVLDLLARHPATARHLAARLAVRFVSDRPPPALVDRLAAAWTAGDGDVGRVLRALVAAPEFWAPEARAAKIKTPFELAISAVRALGAEVARTRELCAWVARMGQPLYAYPTPSGFPDEPEQWLHAGALFNRMGFASALAAGRVDGVLVDLERLAGGRGSEGHGTALAALWGELLPGRPLPTDAAALAMVADPPMEDSRVPRRTRRPSRRGGLPEAAHPLAQIVGVILGSPEFQRR